MTMLANLKWFQHCHHHHQQQQSFHFFHGLRENIVFVSCDFTRCKNYYTCGIDSPKLAQTQQSTCNTNRYHHIDDTKCSPNPFPNMFVGRYTDASIAKRGNVIALNGSQNWICKILLHLSIKKVFIFAMTCVQ